MEDPGAQRTFLLRAATLVTLACAFLAVDFAVAQRPFEVYDPFYRNEKATRVFYDQFALTGELSYRPAGSIQGEGLSALTPDPFGYSLRLDYQLARHFNLGVIMDAAGSAAGRSLSVSWVAVQYFRTVEAADYSFRLAIDPASDGQGGFPQLDAAFIYSALLSPEVSADYAVGMRRVRIGYERLVPLDGPESPPVVSPIVPDYGIIFSRALGWELHAALTYNAFFDPAGSHIYFAVLGQAGSYDMIDEPLSSEESDAEVVSDRVTEYRGGVVWLNSGLEFSRPSYALTPFIGLPLQQWAPEDGEYPRVRLRIGFRAMIR